MKSISQILGKIPFFAYHYPLITTIILSVFLFILGYYFIWSTNKKIEQGELEKTTAIIESIWDTVTKAHEETMKAYFMNYILNKKTLSILKKANSSKPSEQNIARAELFAHLWDSYEYLKDNLFVRQLHFHLPSNKTFLRFHAPNFYGDDLTQHRPTVVLTNRHKKPYSAFETGRVISGFRYVFPIFDFEGNHLGSVEFSKPFESLRKTLSDVHPENNYLLLLRKEDVMTKIFEDFMRFYNYEPFIDGWVMEDPIRELPDSPFPIMREFEQVIKEYGKQKEFRQLIENPNNETRKFKYNEKYYTVTALKLRELDKHHHSAVVIAVANSKDIAVLMETYKMRFMLFLVFISLFSISIYLYLRQTAAIRHKQNELETITSTMGSGLLVADSKGKIIFSNETASNLLGYSKEELIGSHLHSRIHAHQPNPSQCPLFDAIVTGKIYSEDDVFIQKDGKLIDVHVNVSPIYKNLSIKGSVLVFNDISDRKRMERELYRLSFTDTLTGLYNRRFIQEMLLNAKNNFERYRENFSILIIDIDNFKNINDQYGHEMGDKVLVEIAEILNKSIRATDIASRWGGEEFLILLKNTNLDAAVLTAERIRSTVESTKFENLNRVTVCIGVASYNSSEEIRSLISRADNAMYEAKSLGKNLVRTS